MKLKDPEKLWSSHAAVMRCKECNSIARIMSFPKPKAMDYMPTIIGTTIINILIAIAAKLIVS